MRRRRPGSSALSSRWRASSHLVRRFCGSLWPGGAGRADAAWVAGLLSPAELGLWGQLSGPDRRHSVAVARRVSAADRAGPTGVETETLLAAALLHDVGKLEASLGTFSRVGATFAALAFGRSRLTSWAPRRSALGRVGRYLAHDRLGADLLRDAGSDPLIVTWAGQHHLPPERWDLPAAAAAILKAADDD